MVGNMAIALMLMIFAPATLVAAGQDRELASGVRNCVRLCFATCPSSRGTQIYRRCIDTFFEANGCTDSTLDFAASKNGDCPDPRHSYISWGMTSSANAWPHNQDWTHCPSGEWPSQVWTNTGKFDSIDECRTFVQRMEQNHLTSQSKLIRPLTESALTVEGRLALYSHIAYSSRSEIENWNCQSCGTLSVAGSRQRVVFDDAQLTDHDKWNLQGFAEYDSSTDSVIIALRGTVFDDFWNWYLDLMCLKTSLNGYQVHSGFAKGAKILENHPTLSRFLNSHPQSKYTITGHSLGGALAMLMGYNLKQRGFTVQKVITYGQPRVGEPSFANNYDIPYRRVIFAADPVPHIPARLMNYLHPTQELFLSADGVCKTCNNCEKTDCCSNSFSFWQFDVGCHSNVNYVKETAKMLPSKPDGNDGTLDDSVHQKGGPGTSAELFKWDFATPHFSGLVLLVSASGIAASIASAALLFKMRSGSGANSAARSIELTDMLQGQAAA